MSACISTGPAVPMLSEPEGYCPLFHQLHRMTMMDLMGRPYSPYAAGAQCDNCSVSLSAAETVYHCDICKYDLCQKCFASITTCSDCQGTLIRRTVADLASFDSTISGLKCFKCDTFLNQQSSAPALQFVLVCCNCGRKECSECYKGNVCNA